MMYSSALFPSEQSSLEDGSIEKVYWAIVEGEVGRTAGTLEDWLLKDQERGRVEVVEPRTKGARQALLHYLSYKLYMSN